jgi:hypothetical protein
MVVAEIKRLAVRDFCHHAPTSHLLAAVAALGIDHAAVGNSATSRSVAVKRLTEHIASLSGTQSSGAGLVAFLVLLRFRSFAFAFVLFLPPRQPLTPLVVSSRRTKRRWNWWTTSSPASLPTMMSLSLRAAARPRR